VDFSGKGGGGSGGEGGEEEAAAIWVWCFACRHVSPIVLQGFGAFGVGMRFFGCFLKKNCKWIKRSERGRVYGDRWLAKAKGKQIPFGDASQKDVYWLW
jgi:hypothetical protein